jgi:diguanylate cyclase (GGDEF)-like protein
MNTVKELNKQSKLDVAQLLYSNSLVSLFINFTAATLLVVLFIEPHTIQFKVIWWLGFSSVLAYRFKEVFRWKKSVKQPDYSSDEAIKRFTVSIFFTGLLWAVYSLTLLNQIGLLELTCMIIIISAFAGGGVAILAAYELAALTYSFLVLVPFSIALYFTDVHSLGVIGFLGVALFFVLAFSARRTASFTKQAILWKNENAVLVDSMEKEVSIRTKRIYELSNIDPLTGLYNRNSFLLNLEQRVQKPLLCEQKIALLFIDLDGFKKINDSLGHEVGDSILKMTADRLKGQCPNNGLLCRWGGDEFLLCVDFSNIESTKSFANLIIKELSAPYMIDNDLLNLSATIGIALYPEHASNETLLIQWADMAMYSQKKSFPSTVGFFNAQLREKVEQERKLKESLAHAIENDELHLVFQPIVDANSHQLIAFESLLRWELDDKIVSPVEFIPIAEQYGKIKEIGNWVLRQSCIIAQRWPEHINVSVNVSVMQLQDDDFIATVEGILKDTCLVSERLHIEITESVFAQDKNSIIDRVKSLQNLGVAVYIDDFGTEYSSLSIIQDLSANVVKIDKAFVDKIETNGIAIVKAILNIARALDYKVVAEGVETKLQADILKNLGVDSLQGYYFSKPLALSNVDAYINLPINSAPIAQLAE